MSETRPRLDGNAAEAVRHRGGHLQIIASAGSGKTEVVSQRIASLIGEGTAPAAIIAFTFTEKAAAELKSRIELRIKEDLGVPALGLLSQLYVGTIHGYCFRLLQDSVPRFETYDVLDESGTVALLLREAEALGIRALNRDNKLFPALKRFLSSVQVLENELIDPMTMPEPLRSIVTDYYNTLHEMRLMTFGMQISEAVKLLTPSKAHSPHRQVAHLVVDEYQDVNPAQERLISLIAGSGAHLCVVGDDDQSIYQWRGSDTSNIVRFADRYSDVRRFTLTVNYRSLPRIVDAANCLAETIPERLPKTMRSARGDQPGCLEAQVAVWHAEYEAEEAEAVATHVKKLAEGGLRYRDIAILVRGRTAYPRLVAALSRAGIPLRPGGRLGLFMQPEAAALGQAFCALSGVEWYDPQSRTTTVVDRPFVEQALHTVFGLKPASRRALGNWFETMATKVAQTTKGVDLVKDTYELLRVLGVASWDMDSATDMGRLGTVARFVEMVSDYQGVQRRARPDKGAPSGQLGGEDRGEWYYRGLAVFISNFASGELDDFEGVEDLSQDAVELNTIHSAKGLEWSAVFLPSLTATRLPSMKNGERQDWLIPRDRFDVERYEGVEADERRLFYVAITRARDLLSISRHERVNTASVSPSPFLTCLGEFHNPRPTFHAPPLVGGFAHDEIARLSFSEISAYLECGFAYRLRNELGFRPQFAAEIGYGRAIHHIVRLVAEMARQGNGLPGTDGVSALVRDHLYLPNAGRFVHERLRNAATELLKGYFERFGSVLIRTGAAERTFQLHLDGVVVSGRADLLLEPSPEEPGLTLIDFKTASADSTRHELQLQIYAEAGRREGLDIRHAYIHDLEALRERPVDLSEGSMQTAREKVAGVALALRRRSFTPNPEKQRCTNCDVRQICSHAAA
jgi:DNA helicase-2/ATP-dependent DNA helicase PcrA